MSYNQVHGKEYLLTEKGYPRPGKQDKEGEYSYIYTECDNYWYSVKKDPMFRDKCICPKCGKTVLVQVPENWW